MRRSSIPRICAAIAILASGITALSVPNAAASGTCTRADDDKIWNGYFAGANNAVTAARAKIQFAWWLTYCNKGKGDFTLSWSMLEADEAADSNKIGWAQTGWWYYPNPAVFAQACVNWNGQSCSSMPTKYLWFVPIPDNVYYNTQLQGTKSAGRIHFLYNGGISIMNPFAGSRGWVNAWSAQFASEGRYIADGMAGSAANGKVVFSVVKVQHNGSDSTWYQPPDGNVDIGYPDNWGFQWVDPGSNNHDFRTWEK